MLIWPNCTMMQNTTLIFLKAKISFQIEGMTCQNFRLMIFEKSRVSSSCFSEATSFH